MYFEKASQVLEALDISLLLYELNQDVESVVAGGM
jgi:hypothetical protein